MTIITEVGASYIDHMNDVLEVNSFLTNVTRSLLPHFFGRREPGNKARAAWQGLRDS